MPDMEIQEVTVQMDYESPAGAFQPTEYLVELWNGNTDPAEVWTTFGSWVIEGQYLIVWDALGVRAAHIIPEDVHMITTKEVAYKQEPTPLAESIEGTGIGGRHEMTGEGSVEENA